MNRDILIGIGISGTICAIGIVSAPPIVPELTALFAAGLGALALMTAAWRHHHSTVGLGATALLAIGGFALATGILTGAAALGAAPLMVGAAILLGRTLLWGWAPGQRLPGGDSA